MNEEAVDGESERSGIDRILDIPIQLHVELGRRKMRIHDLLQVQVGSSIGISISTAGSSSANLMQSADEAMYSAKHAGKGRIVQHSDLSQDSEA